MMSEYTLELAELMELEGVIERGLATFMEVGEALLRIREGKKYRAAGFDTFEEYCAERWGMPRQHAYRLMDAAETVRVLEMSPIGDILPTAEGQARPLTSLPLEERADAWEEAVTRANGKVPTAAIVADVVKQRREPLDVPKPTVAEGIPAHPATFSRGVLAAIRELLGKCDTVLDPFAGVGTIHELQPDYITVGVEIEPEWASAHPSTRVGDSRNLPFEGGLFDAVATSPTYGNRLADSYAAYDPQARRSYAIDLGRKLTAGNSGGMHFARDGEYEELHRTVWRECARVLKQDGLFILNVKDFQRDGLVIPVTAWHMATLLDLGFVAVDIRIIPVTGLPNATALLLSETVIAYQRMNDEQ